MKTFLFTLSMPNIGSWNGKWTGAGDLHCIVRTYPEKSALLPNIESKPSHYYNFGDGWGASVQIEKIAGKEAAKYRKKSKGFCGYDWMVNEIESFGRIKTVEERRAKKGE